MKASRIIRRAMTFHFLNYQDKHDPNYGRAISTENELFAVLDHARQASPFVAELCGASDFHITIGIGRDVGCVQYGRVDGMPPYLMAMSRRPPMKRGCVEFLCGNTPTPVAARYILSSEELREIALHFIRTGERSDSVSWQELNPKACKEDAERPPDA